MCKFCEKQRQQTKTEKTLPFVAQLGFSGWSNCLSVASFRYFLPHNLLYSKRNCS